MNDVAKPDELERRDIIGMTEGGYVIQIFNVDRPDQLIKLYTPDEADKVALALTQTA